MNSGAQICVKWNRLSAEDLGLLLRRESDAMNTKIFAIYPRLYFSWLAKGVRKARMPSGFVVIIGVYLLLSFFIIIIIILLEMGLSSCTCLEFRIIRSLSEKKAAFYPRRWTDISRAPTSWFGAEKKGGNISQCWRRFWREIRFFFFFFWWGEAGHPLLTQRRIRVTVSSDRMTDISKVTEAGHRTSLPEYRSCIINISSIALSKKKKKYSSKSRSHWHFTNLTAYGIKIR